MSGFDASTVSVSVSRFADVQAGIVHDIIVDIKEKGVDTKGISAIR